MYKGKVTGGLYIRAHGPNRHGGIEGTLEKGEIINIKRAVNGEKIRGEKLWYQLESGSYVWSGRVRTDEDITAPTKRVIFTADDYGVVRTIDAGILSAVKNGLLNSVTCFTNFGDGGIRSLENIRTLEKLKDKYQLEIGVHLTITSGSPILGRVSVPTLCRDEDDVLKHYDQSDFCDYTKLNKKYRKLDGKGKSDFLKELKRELTAQLEVFTDPPDGGDPINIDHITSHHNSLLYQKEFFEIMIELSKRFGVVYAGDDKRVPLRSLENIPSFKDSAFYVVKGKILLPGHLIRSLKKIVNSKNNNTLNTPGLLHSNHFGPIPFFEKSTNYSLYRLKEKKMRKSKKMLDDHESGMFCKNDHDTMEFLLHLRKGDPRTHEEFEKHETRPTGYAGINPLSFDGRTAEYLSFTEFFKRKSGHVKGTEIKLREGMVRGTWNEL